LLKNGSADPLLQRQIAKIFYGCLGVFAILSIVAFIRLQDQILYYFFPFFGERMDPWGRPRVGKDFDALLSMAGIFELFVACSFGVVAALGRTVSPGPTSFSIARATPCSSSSCRQFWCLFLCGCAFQ
jgi:hypothetical protein